MIDTGHGTAKKGKKERFDRIGQIMNRNESCIFFKMYYNYG